MGTPPGAALWVTQVGSNYSLPFLREVVCLYVRVVVHLCTAHTCTWLLGCMWRAEVCIGISSSVTSPLNFLCIFDSETGIVTKPGSQRSRKTIGSVSETLVTGMVEVTSSFLQGC